MQRWKESRRCRGVQTAQTLKSTSILDSRAESASSTFSCCILVSCKSATRIAPSSATSSSLQTDHFTKESVYLSLFHRLCIIHHMCVCLYTVLNCIHVRTSDSESLVKEGITIPSIKYSIQLMSPSEAKRCNTSAAI